MSEMYPVPTTPPVYDDSDADAPPRPPRLGRIYAVLDSVFILFALAATVWLAIIMLLGGLSLSPSRLILLVLFWALTAYLALPRLHQVFTTLYVPDYFIGRSRTGDGLLGDPINLALDGHAEDIHAAMQRAEWTLADPITLRSSWKIIVSSLLRRSYDEAPVSDLFLFGNKQAFAYQQEVGGSASKRHHVRFWPVPHGWILPGGHVVHWLAAGTYDRSVGLSAFTGQVTHKIDSNIDAERDYIVNTVRYADPEVAVDVIKDFSTAYHARNGGGDSVRTDGALPILDVTGARSRVGKAPILPAERMSRNDHHIPPLGVILAGILVIINLATAISMALNLASDPSMQGITGTAMNITRGVLVSIGGLYVVLWLFTLARKRWARLGLMIFFSVDAISALTTTQVTDPGWVPRLALTALTTLALLSISDDASRAWVRPKKQD